jgi:hypothetical protein
MKQRLWILAFSVALALATAAPALAGGGAWSG